jgi:hypothetical protein
MRNTILYPPPSEREKLMFENDFHLTPLTPSPHFVSNIMGALQTLPRWRKSANGGGDTGVGARIEVQA